MKVKSLWLAAAGAIAAVAAAAYAQEDVRKQLLEHVADRHPETNIKKIDAERLAVRRLDIVDENGTIRMTLAAPLPGPIVDGVEYKRSHDVSGLMLRDDKGNERGGFAYNTGLGGPILALDHVNGEAAGFAVREDGETFMFIGQRAPIVREPSLDNRILPAVQRTASIHLGMTPEGKASLDLTDPQGRPRIRFMVTAEGYGAVEFLDAEGETVSTLTPERENGVEN